MSFGAGKTAKAGAEQSAEKAGFQAKSPKNIPHGLKPTLISLRLCTG